MRKAFLICCSIFFLFIPRLGSTAYLIQLVNGSTYLTDHYWEEDSSIKFNHYGGIIGFTKSTIQAITKTDKAYVDPTYLKTESYARTDSRTLSSFPASAKQENTYERIDLNKTRNGNSIDLLLYVDEKNDLMVKYIEAQNKLHLAMKSRDRIAQRQAAREISRIERARAKLAKKIRGKNNGVLPSWWQQKTGIEKDAP